MFLAHRLVEEYLRDLISGNLEIDDAFDEVEYFHSLATVRRDLQHYMGLFGFAKPAFTDFSDSGPAQALFFGCEPFLLARNTSAGGDEHLNICSVPPSTRKTAAPFTSISRRWGMAATRSSPVRSRHSSSRPS